MRKISLISIISALLFTLFTFSACGDSDPMLGRWVDTASRGSFTLEFSSNGRGVRESNRFAAIEHHITDNFTWSVDEGVLEIIIEGSGQVLVYNYELVDDNSTLILKTGNIVFANMIQLD